MSNLIDAGNKTNKKINADENNLSQILNQKKQLTSFNKYDNFNKTSTKIQEQTNSYKQPKDFKIPVIDDEKNVEEEISRDTQVVSPNRNLKPVVTQKNVNDNKEYERSINNKSKSIISQSRTIKRKQTVTQITNLFVPRGRADRGLSDISMSKSQLKRLKNKNNPQEEKSQSSIGQQNSNDNDSEHDIKVLNNRGFLISRIADYISTRSLKNRQDTNTIDNNKSLSPLKKYYNKTKYFDGSEFSLNVRLYSLDKRNNEIAKIEKDKLAGYGEKKSDFDLNHIKNINVKNRSFIPSNSLDVRKE